MMILGALLFCAAIIADIRTLIFTIIGLTLAFIVRFATEEGKNIRKTH